MHEQIGQALSAVDSVSRPISGIESIPPGQVVERLDLTNLSRPLLQSVGSSIWGTINGGRIVLECRNLSILQQAKGGSVYIYDLDDCLISSSGWHKKEYELIGQNEALLAQGVNIDPQKAKEIYELSKIKIAGIAEKEPRYTPHLNLVLLSLYADALAEAQKKESDPAQPWNEMLTWRKEIIQKVSEFGERALRAYAVNPSISRMFSDNSPVQFLYADFVQDALNRTGPRDIRIIATRGKIEGLLGQVYKVHKSGLMRQRSSFGQSVDLVIYSNDVKAEALLSMLDLLPGIGNRLISIYDDNPNEIMPYLKVAKILGVQNIEVVQVSHPDAKRRDVSVGIEPTLSYMLGNARLRHFSPNLSGRQYYIGWDNGEEMQACHACVITVPDDADPREAAHMYLKYHEGFHILESLELVEPGKDYRRF